MLDSTSTESHDSALLFNTKMSRIMLKKQENLDQK